VNGFFHRCANMAWGMTGIKAPPLSVLRSFYKQKVLVMLQRAQMVSILKCDVTIGEGSFRLGVLSWGPPLSLFDMLLVPGKGLGTWCALCGSPSQVVFFCSWTWVLPFYSLYSPLFGCFDLFMIRRVSIQRSYMSCSSTLLCKHIASFW
jgi:hypothetical protein